MANQPRDPWTKVGIQLPASVAAELGRSVTESAYPEKRMHMTAAMLAWLALPQSEQQKLLNLVAGRMVATGTAPTVQQARQALKGE